MSDIPLTPVLFLERAATAFGGRTAIVDGSRTYLYSEFVQRARQLAGAIVDVGLAPGERVGALCTNSHVLLELYNAAPQAGAVLVPINTRLSLEEMVAIVRHSGVRLLVATEELADTAKWLAARVGVAVIVEGPEGDYEERLRAAQQHALVTCSDERSLLSINYTSGSTGRPKGVMYSHRGVYLQALAMVHHAQLSVESSYLWTLPMFHCNGWCFVWAVTAAGGVHVCVRKIDPPVIWRTICASGVTHMSGAPTVLGMIAEAASALPNQRPARRIRAQTGGAPPTPALLGRLAELEIDVIHLYGLTETYGPAVVNEWQPEWSNATADEKARLNARQGVQNVITSGVRVVDLAGDDVPADAHSVGEIVLQGNNVMLGYYDDTAATEEALINGWFRTGDLGIRHPDGYIELTDRAKDIIITGGENVASVEIERALSGHPAVLESAVVAKADERWGEVPVAFVTLKDGATANADELIEFVRSRLAHFKAPKEIHFTLLPKTSTGKIQKHLLRSSLWGPQDDATDGRK
jgi:fatty-acyl-CoA synthase